MGNFEDRLKTMMTSVPGVLLLVISCERFLVVWGIRDGRDAAERMDNISKQNSEVSFAQPNKRSV